MLLDLLRQILNVPSNNFNQIKKKIVEFSMFSFYTFCANIDIYIH